MANASSLSDPTPLICRAACVQLTTTNDLEANCREAERLIEEAAAQGATFIALPENAFFMRASDRESPALYAPHEHPGVQTCQRLAVKHRAWILIGSVFTPSPACQSGTAKWYNRSVMINPEGRVAALYDKIHLFDASISQDQVYRESDRIQYGERLSLVETPWGRLGLTICYDMRFPHLYRDLAKAGAVWFAAPAAFTYATGTAHWHVLLRARAIETGSFVIAPGQCGIHPGGRRTYGHSLIVGPWGEILAEASEDRPEVIVADLDMTRVARVRRELPCLQHDRAYRPMEDFSI